VLLVLVAADRVDESEYLQILDFHEEVLTALEELLRVGVLRKINFLGS
jgi:hypothetical protein